MSREGPGNERWLIGRHVDRILESMSAPIFWENLDRRVWLVAVSNAVTALAHIAAPHAKPEVQKEWDEAVAGASDMEDWLALFGEVYSVLAERKLIGYGTTPHEDASEMFEGLIDDDESG